MNIPNMRHFFMLWMILPALLCGCGNDDVLAEKALVGLPAGMVEEKITDGTGAQPVPGQTATVSYVGTLTDGTQFDSSVNTGRDFPFMVGGGQVIRGFDAAVQNMKVGGRSKFTIPPNLAYGSSGAPPTIPPNATLIFDITLVSVTGGTGSGY
jgi:FKBP-type peptidyl-prolyl cis-trans isomerase